jgi:hypothetical protein
MAALMLRWIATPVPTRGPPGRMFHAVNTSTVSLERWLTSSANHNASEVGRNTRCSVRSAFPIPQSPYHGVEKRARDERRLDILADQDADAQPVDGRVIQRPPHGFPGSKPR